MNLNYEMHHIRGYGLEERGASPPPIGHFSAEMTPDWFLPALGLNFPAPSRAPRPGPSAAWSPAPARRTPTARRPGRTRLLPGASPASEGLQSAPAAPTRTAAPRRQ